MVVEEDASTRFAAGFRPLRVCTRFLEHQLGRPVWEGAYGDRCTFAHSWAEHHPEASAQNNSSPRTFLTEAVVAASGEWPGRREERGSEAARCSCAEDRDDGRGRPCALQ